MKATEAASKGEEGAEGGSRLVPLEESLEKAVAIGIDSGATLAKVCIRPEVGPLQIAAWTSPATARLLDLVERLSPERIGLTGCGALGLAPEMGDRTPIVEFEAWARGANALMSAELVGSPEIRSPDALDSPSGEARHGADRAPYLLVSIGTGTSAVRVDGDQVERVGGTALGGGAALGLGVALVGCRSHTELAELASRGDRSRVDLMIGDIYELKDVPLAAAGTAAAFGKLARQAVETEDAGESTSLTHNIRDDSSGDHAAEGSGMASRPSREDLAAAVMWLVAENVTLQSIALARAAKVDRIVFGGSTLLANPRLEESIELFSKALGIDSIILPHSGHAGALGAMLLSD